MTTLLTHLDIDRPILAAPMAGGASTPALVTATARAGGLGFLAGGYKSAQALAGQIHTVESEGVPFGVNLFARNPIPVPPKAYQDYARLLQNEADRYGLTLSDTAPLDDDDHWADKIALLVAHPVPWVSFTFGIPDAGTVTSLRRAGTTVLQCVTTPAEARLAVDAGVDALIVQGPAAGGHSATLTPERPVTSIALPDLVTAVRHTVALPVIATGGIATPADVAAVLQAGAQAAMVGTVLLRTDESGASAPHKAALADPDFDTTVITRAFTGRPARALRNHFTDRYSAHAPAGYPALHHLTSPLRKAATAAGDTDLIHLWAGTGFRQARTEPVAHTAERLTGRL
ncbi:MULTISPECIES: NAD(P)H-dependent flavin oxidoreductase [Streptomyces]|uniref:Propionate 3-nitronate monooxygenase n=2 Tax=Streptomyces rimosus subsp. rimosus TaxID=132474 RepID=L8F3E9_STRR1|nr:MULTISPECIES: nitronate monooxygenase [Streptomyces]KOG73263.1 2-nitropropane dioxygenase [Kitasatospora aureofaciens]MYT42183.1 nitronate monooxygenase [Streptomyces sp. SID5471]KOT39505.1 2-nitropropane dioxygenase [Streptomyces sp. NRRL WC-3701]KOT57867.1 2-nitropropane dioxygenase [Streptomyces rimosus subsp. rimosus]KOT62273.1 2-nitropropane dioxygenase [Streptomyces rimosus subsp. rimosus]